MNALVPLRQNGELLRLEEYNRVIDAPKESRISEFVWLGAGLLSLFFGAGLTWALETKLDGAVVAPASFVVEGNRKTVQHLDGGIVRSLMVADGDFVDAGQTLISLDSTEAEVDLTVLGSQIGELAARQARLLAQIERAPAFGEADVLGLTGSNLPRVHWESAYLTQRQVFDAAERARRTEEDIQGQRIQALEAQIAGLEEQRAASLRQIEISTTELADLEKLFDKGLVAAPRINGVRLDIERLRGLDAALRTDRARAENEIGTIRLDGISRQKQRDQAAAAELAAVEAQLALVEPQYRGAEARQQRVAITAPVSGRVVNLSVHTAGAVLRPGQEILDIVPAEEGLVVEARIDTADIDKLSLGQVTRVRLSGFDQGEVPEAQGRIVDLSADSLRDERTGQAYYLARVKLAGHQPPAVQELDLVPGMPADLFVNTGERTAFSYLTQPLTDRIARTFVE